MFVSFPELSLWRERDEVFIGSTSVIQSMVGASLNHDSPAAKQKSLTRFKTI